MAINDNKTGLLCVSTACGYDPRVDVVVNGQKMTGSKNMRTLGVTLDCDFSFKTHVQNVNRKVLSRSWALVKLKKAGLNEQRLIKAYNPAKFFQRFFQEKSNLRGYTEIRIKKCKPRKCN